ncbi:MAG: 4Fe-4S ferredoxin [Archaeoglobus sp.]|jgi:ferredoxin|nr:MAG: 4Fe-4S ferredoxin [Archaeoglobus sp.]
MPDRGRIVVDRFKCAYCGACVSVCKNNANELVETFLTIDDSKCNCCMLCVKVCPMGALSVKS